MKSCIIALLLFVMYVGDIFPQRNYNYYDTTISFPDNELSTFIDESKPGAPSLKYVTVFMPLRSPEESLSDINIQILDFSKENRIIINPLISQENDSVISYRRTEQVYDSYITDSDVYPVSLTKYLGTVYLSGNYYAAVQVCMQQYEWKKNSVKKFNKVKLIIRTNKRATVERAASFKENNWRRRVGDYLKFKIAREGIYRIYYEDLLDIGVKETMIMSDKIQIYNYGVPVPVYVDDKNDGVFDEGDYIEFYSDVNKNHQDYKKVVRKGEDYIDYMNRYTDTTIVWLSLNSEDVLRVNTVSIESKGNVDTIDYSLTKKHYEEDNILWYYDAAEPRTQLPFWQEHKVWTWRAIGGNGKFSLNLDLNDLIPERGIKAEARLISNSADVNDDAHRICFSLNDLEYGDTATFDFRQTVNLSADFDNVKSSGNILSLYSLPTRASFNQSLIDWVDVEYYSRNHINGTKKIIADAEIDRRVNAIMFYPESDSENFIAYKIHPVYSKMNIIKDRGGINYFLDTVANGDAYFIANQREIEKPIFCGERKFGNLPEESPADYIIITREDLTESVQEYGEFLKDKYDLKVKVILIEEIYDLYSFGYPFPEAIKEFLQEIYYNQINDPPEYLLLIGDANYDYKNKFKPLPPVRRQNIVPSYGYPVSDNWFVIWNDSIPIPQMAVGRIPAVNNEQVRFYLEKHRRYLAKPYDDWNKSFMFFSGGDPSKPEQLEMLRDVNDKIFHTFTGAPPFEGRGVHFYKTLNPASNFSNMPSDTVEKAIKEGAVIISYIGHSGVQTWDNGILSVNDLMNNYEDRNPLITDFGCSTGKFAEPDIVSFAEEFTNNNENGQAIAYLANSSWGYLSTSLNFPPLFYNFFLSDTISPVGKIFIDAKKKLIEYSGLNDVVKVFCYCSHLFGDPIIKIRLPEKPDLVMGTESFSISSEIIKDNQKSIGVNLKYYNYGKSAEDSYYVKIEHSWSGSTDTIIIRCANYKFRNSLRFDLNVKNRPGKHFLKCILDYNNEIDEYDDSNNSGQTEFYVRPSDVRLLTGSQLYSGFRDTLVFLNPPFVESGKLEIELADNRNFSNAEKLIIPFGNTFTKLILSDKHMNNRIWLRFKNYSDTLWSETYSFAPYGYDWIFAEPLDLTETKFHGLTYDSASKAWSFLDKEKTLKLVSAGQTAGSVASLQIDNVEYFPTTYFWGIVAALLDTADLNVVATKYFLYPSSNSAEELIKFIDTLSSEYYVAMAVCDDGYQSVIGYKGGNPVREAIKKLGSKLIDSVGYRDSWCLLGQKGGNQILEEYQRRYNGLASIVLHKKVSYPSGYLTTPGIVNFSQIHKIYLDSEVDAEALALCKMEDNSFDTLIVDTAVVYDGILNNKKYKSVFFFISSQNKGVQKEFLKYIAADVTLPPELIIRYESVSTNKDTFYAGENALLSFDLVNAGEESAVDFDIEVLIDKKEKLLISVDTIKSGESKTFTQSITTESYNGETEYEILIDPGNTIKEIYEDNNSTTGKFYVRQMDAGQEIAVRIDGREIYDGEYISQTPQIEIELYDYSFRKLNDTSYMKILLNGKPVNYSNDNIQYIFSDNNPKIIVYYNPNLSAGDYLLEVLAYNFYSDSTKLIKSLRFRTDDKPRLLDVYNYPNPFESETYFTFRLTQVPDELKIKIYTVAGRLIKEIVVKGNSLKYDLNRIYWDGRDEDGNFPANGVYLYHAVLYYGDKRISAINKLAILR
ncbi:C25 family cysteine peptidase [Melioribacter sp. Ez-97]|uniref:C25 family cysteine peptidase n=1 Tax=Melioribacter sp. Ez-97 TaxID=3423434 RepID=UPI003ED985CF